MKTRIQRLDGLFFVEKGQYVHSQRILKMSRIYTLAEILSLIFVKKNDGKLGTLLTNLFFIKIYDAITACTTTSILTNRKMVNFQKWDFFFDIS